MSVVPDIKNETPIKAVEQVLDRLGYDIDDIDDLIVTFGIPNQNGSTTSAEATFFPETGQLQLTAVYRYGKLRPPLEPGLLVLLNCFQILMPGNAFTFEEGVKPEVDDEIRVSILTFVPQDLDECEKQIKKAIDILEHTMQTIMPAVLVYVSQEIRVRVNAKGKCKVTQYTVTLQQCFAMAEIGTFGRA